MSCSPGEKDYIAAMDSLHFQPEDKEAIVNQVVSAMEKGTMQRLANKEVKKTPQDTHEE